ncbi:DUF4352 domain-containing protein [Streptomyces sp. NPDC051577]|uniref:DUF4352 domain-containing protein n=1 Tax=Streptomyces sp. NPDC051577 TaxID=3155166 RepID=UPI003440D005
MSQQPPYDNQPPPGYGYSPPQPPPRKSGAGKIVGFSCLGIVGLVVVLAVAGSMLGDDTDDKTVKPSAAGASAVEAGGPGAGREAGEEVAHHGHGESRGVQTERVAQGDYTSVSVTVTNNSTKQISVNPLYFAITDTAGTKHGPELGVDEAQIDTVDLAPGENVTGVISGKGRFTAKKVTYTDDLLGDGVRADVS